jgi:hypothetical protein
MSASSSVTAVRRVPRRTRTALLTQPEERDGAAHFPRRWPGVGASFQCPVPSSIQVYTTDRAAPERMSEEYPHGTQMEIETAWLSAEENRGKRGLWRGCFSVVVGERLVAVLVLLGRTRVAFASRRDWCHRFLTPACSIDPQHTTL